MMRKNVIKDYFIRTYAVALVMIAFLLFLDMTVFILARGVLQPGEGSSFTVKYFSFMGGDLIMAVVFPAVMLYLLLGGCFDRGAGDLYQSLPPSRNEMFGSAVCVITGYEAAFLLLQMFLRMILIAATKGFQVRKYFYGGVIWFTLALYLVFLAMAILCFCASAGTFGYFGRVGFWVVLLWTLMDGVTILFFHKQMIFHWEEFDVSGTIPVKLENTFRNIGSRLLFEDYDIELGAEAWELRIARDSGLFLAIFGLVLLLVAWLAFKKRPAERTNGRNRSEIMHVSLQVAAILTVVMGSGVTVYDYAAVRRFLENNQIGELIMAVLRHVLWYGVFGILFLCIWELLYRKKLREVPKVWKSLVIGTVFSALAVVYVMCDKL
ncbi:MAG: hypothetical protein J5648_05560 [Lachnospiraceae bacterium]|nr:hypothetical protein [Lachnospiraceae bacterium]